MKDITREYTNGEVVVVWKPAICIHSGICARGLRKVFRPKEQPWINMESATSVEIVEQIKKCPSGALSFRMKDSIPE